LPTYATGSARYFDGTKRPRFTVAGVDFSTFHPTRAFPDIFIGRFAERSPGSENETPGPLRHGGWTRRHQAKEIPHSINDQ
jgi:hypothetical protein